MDFISNEILENDNSKPCKWKKLTSFSISDILDPNLMNISCLSKIDLEVKQTQLTNENENVPTNVIQSSENYNNKNIENNKNDEDNPNVLLKDCQPKLEMHTKKKQLFVSKEKSLLHARVNPSMLTVLITN